MAIKFLTLLDYYNQAIIQAKLYLNNRFYQLFTMKGYYLESISTYYLIMFIYFSTDL